MTSPDLFQFSKSNFGKSPPSGLVNDTRGHHRSKVFEVEYMFHWLSIKLEMVGEDCS